MESSLKLTLLLTDLHFLSFRIDLEGLRYFSCESNSVYLSPREVKVPAIVLNRLDIVYLSIHINIIQFVGFCMEDSELIGAINRKLQAKVLKVD